MESRDKASGGGQPEDRLVPAEDTQTWVKPPQPELEGRQVTLNDGTVVRVSDSTVPPGFLEVVDSSGLALKIHYREIKGLTHPTREDLAEAYEAIARQSGVNRKEAEALAVDWLNRDYKLPPEPQGEPGTPSPASTRSVVPDGEGKGRVVDSQGVLTGPEIVAKYPNHIFLDPTVTVHDTTGGNLQAADVTTLKPNRSYRAFRTDSDQGFVDFVAVTHSAWHPDYRSYVVAVQQKPEGKAKETMEVLLGRDVQVVAPGDYHDTIGGIAGIRKDPEHEGAYLWLVMFPGVNRGVLAEPAALKLETRDGWIPMDEVSLGPPERAESPEANLPIVRMTYIKLGNTQYIQDSATPPPFELKVLEDSKRLIWDVLDVDTVPNEEYALVPLQSLDEVEAFCEKVEEAFEKAGEPPQDVVLSHYRNGVGVQVWVGDPGNLPTKALLQGMVERTSVTGAS